jgi:hypothetical protein
MLPFMQAPPHFSPPHPSDSYGTLSQKFPFEVSGPSNFSIDQVKNEICLIRSEDRDQSVYPDSTNFVIDLPQRWQNVKSIRVIQARIPRLGWRINGACDTFKWREVEGGTILEAKLLHGNYPVYSTSSNSICSLLTDAMNTLTQTGSSYSVIYDEFSERITIGQLGGGSGYFEILAGQSGRFLANMAKSLGFKPEVYSGALEYEAPNVYQPDNLDGCVIQAQVGERRLGKVVSSVPQLSEALAIVWTDLAGTYFDYRDTSTSQTAATCEQLPILGKLSNLRLQIRRLDGEIMDLGGMDWIIQLEIGTIVPPRSA